ncbi:MAG: hypothetical protein AAB592_04345 [Patescibacteria group bacterium]
MKRLFCFVFFLIIIPTAVSAVNDLSIASDGISFNRNLPFLEGQLVRIYATVENKGDTDLKGVAKFFAGNPREQIGTDQPISAVLENTDTVFVDASFIPGSHLLTITVIPFDADDDVIANNNLTTTITVLSDSDRDGKTNELDTDDDNDGVLDLNDAFPLDRKESRDTDGDGTGDNTDTDDDNDGVLDLNDAFSLDARESKDTDSDGVGDTTDIYPTNPLESRDFDNDGVGDNSDTDADNDDIEKTSDTNDTNLGPILEVDRIPSLTSTEREIVIDPSESSDPDGTVVAITVVINELSAPADGVQNVSPFETTLMPGEKLPYRFAQEGQYSVVVNATDDKGESRSKTFEVTVRNLLSYWVKGVIWLLVFVVFLIAITMYRKVRNNMPKPRKNISKKAAISVAKKTTTRSKNKK